MSIRSGAEPDPGAADRSLSDVALTHRGLTYPHGRNAPGPGEIFQIGERLLWTRTPLPGSLGHINHWLIEEGDGLAIVDCGLASSEAREAWTRLFDGPLAGRTVSRVIVTHFHPDHVGLAGWLTRRFDAPLWMSRGEYLLARTLTLDVRDAPPADAVSFWRLAGWEAERIEEESAKGWGRFASAVSPIPDSYVRLRDGDRLDLDGQPWRIVVGSGHSPEHACLMDEGERWLIAGDQVLPRITSNVSLGLIEPQADPLGEWLDSIDRFLTLPDALLVLPAHGEPFYGLHARLKALAGGHRARLDALVEKLGTPLRVVDCFTTLFGRKIPDSALGLATGEALAHLRRLEVEGRAVRQIRDGVAFFVRAAAA